MTALLRTGEVAAAIVLSAACVSQSQMQVARPLPDAAGVALRMRLDPCRDRTGFKTRDLATEATRLIDAKLRAMPNVELLDAAPLVMSCEVTQFVEGSAFKRWLMPGLGSTVGQIALMLSDAKDQSALVIIQGNATVSAGGFYTVGAENYILNSAADEAIAKLRAWAAGPEARLAKP